MDCFKTKAGKQPVYDISQENYNKYTQKIYPYIQKGSDGNLRYFAICPYCDNPIQFIGLFTPSQDGRIYGKHYNRGVNGLASHNEQAYRLCPVASQNYNPPGKDARKKEKTDLEIEIYNIVRGHFDQVMYVLKQDTGIKFSKKDAEDILETYFQGNGWMYYWGTLYNIPWSIFYMCHGFDIYGKMISKDSHLAEVLAQDKRFKLEKVQSVENSMKSRCIVVKTTEWVETNYMFESHSRKKVNDDILETMKATLSIKCDDKWEMLWSETIEINVNRFPNLIISSDRSKYKNKELLDIAEKIMPELE